MQLEFTRLLAGRFAGEVPLWDDRRNCLFFVDLAGLAVHSARLDGQEHRSWPVPRIPGSIGLGESGRLVVAQPDCLLTLDPDTGTITELARVDGEPEGNRLNDGKVGPDGAFWVGSMDDRPVKQQRGTLYRVTGDGRVEVRLREYIKVSNGLAWSPDGRTMYFSDSRGPWLDRFDFDPATGALGEGSRFADFSEAIGRPDGGAVDAEGRYWSAGVSAGVLNVLSTAGVIEHVIPTPMSAPSMPAFCGPDLDMLVVTSLNPPTGTTEWEGAVVMAKSPVKGAPVHRWRDA